MTRYSFTVPGPPVPKGRPRLGRGGHTYTPRRTKRHELAVYWSAAQAGVRAISGPVQLTVRFYLSTCRRVDVDNLLKLIMDALNTRGWSDDSQVVSVGASRHYDPLHPRTEIEIQEVVDVPAD